MKNLLSERTSSLRRTGLRRGRTWQFLASERGPMWDDAVQSLCAGHEKRQGILQEAKH